MRPHGVAGLEIESTAEAFALGTILADAQEFVPADSGYLDVLEPTATYVTGRAEAHVLQHGVGSSERFSLVFGEQISASMVKTLVGLAAQSHPNPAIRQTAGDMQRSYAGAVFDDGMRDAPPPAGPQRYRPPFTD